MLSWLFSKSKIDKKILHRLRNNDATYTSLKLKSDQLGAEGAQALRTALEKNTTLTSLKLYNNKLGAEEAKVLEGVLEKNTALTLLNLGKNLISDAGAKALAAGLEKNTTLTLLNLSNNQIGPEGAKALAGVIEKNTTLTSLDLRFNPIDDEGAEELIKALEKNTVLTSLNLWDNEIEESTEIHIACLTWRNQQYLKELQAAACQQLKMGRLLLYKANSNDSKNNLFTTLPLEIREKIVMHTGEENVHLIVMGTGENVHLIDEQLRLVLDYAEGKIEPVADKLSFFQVTRCDRLRKKLHKGKVDAAERKPTKLVP